MHLPKTLLIASVLVATVAGCGTQSASAPSSTSSSAPMTSSTPMTSSAPMSSSASAQSVSSTSTPQVVLANGQFQPATVTVSPGQSVTFVFNGMGSDYIDLISGGHLVAHSPLLNKGGTWTYAFEASGTYTVEPQTMTYIHGTVTVK